MVVLVVTVFPLQSMAQQLLVQVVEAVAIVLAVLLTVAQAAAVQVVQQVVTELLAQLTQVVAVAGHPGLQLAEPLAVPVLSSSVTSGGNVVQAVQSHRLVATPSIHLHRLPRIQHKEKLNVTFCKSC
jgi:hypothetical protein